MFGRALTFPLLILSLFDIPAAFGATSKPPNVVFILSDDQDAQMNSLDYMPLLKKYLLDEGTHFRKHYCTVALCCPSRVSLWTGKAAHNTNVTAVNPPYGGYPKFVDQGLNDKYLPVWLQEAGYNTYYVGKLFNSHSISNYATPFPNGFTGSDFLLDPNTYSYLNPIFQRNKLPPVQHNNEYNTDLVAEKGLGFLDDAIKADKPFFVTIAPIAPHAEFNVTIQNLSSAEIIKSPPVPANRHANLFSDAVVPRTPNFNPDTPSGVGWIAEQPKLSAENITYNDLWYRQRLRSLATIDEMIEQVITKLQDYDLLDNTYIFYSSDNGYHISQHRFQPGKGCGFEEDINVPLIVRGPGVPTGEVVDLATSHTDLAPTFFDILGLPLRSDFDGIPIPLTSDRIEEKKSSGKAKEHVQVEYWSYTAEGEYNEPDVKVNNTYKGLRIVAEDYGFYYAVWCTGDHQLYDMKADPYQMNNMYTSSSSNTTNGTSPTYSNSIAITVGSCTVPITKLEDRLDSLVFVLKTCIGKACSDPWNALLPNSGVATLEEALDSKFDEYFAGLPRVEYNWCAEGYILDAEGLVFNGQGFIGKRMNSQNRA